MTKDEIKRELKLYYEYHREVDAIVREISQLTADRDRIFTVGSKFDGQPRGTDTSDPTYSQARQRIDYYDSKIEAAVDRQKEYLDKLARIDRWLDMLPVIRRKIVSEKYCKQREWEVVAREVKYSPQHCRRLADEAIGFISRMSA